MTAHETGRSAGTAQSTAGGSPPGTYASQTTMPSVPQTAGEPVSSVDTASSRPGIGAHSGREIAPAHTSAAAGFALALGVAALLMVLTVVLSPVGLVAAAVGVVLGIVGLRMARKPGVTGRTVALVGLVLSAIALLMSIAFAIGITTFLNDRGAVDRLQEQVQNVRDRLPDRMELPRP